MKANFVNLAGDYSQMHGGLPRHALHGVAAGGQAGPTIAGIVSPVDLNKHIAKAKPAFFPEGGTDVERSAMAFHSKGDIASFRVLPNGNVQAANFRVNKNPAVPGGAYSDPCQDDAMNPVNSGGTNLWFSASSSAPLVNLPSGAFGAYTPRIYKGVNIQYDAVINKVGYHYPQQRIVSLWEDAIPVIEKNKPGEPLVMRINTFDCTMYHHTNLVPEIFEMDDYQLRTPTDIIGQHIHLPKWDLTTTDGAANGWNYEDGTLSPGTVRERIEAINCFNGEATACRFGALPGPGTGFRLHPEQHPFFPATGPGGVDWRGARITLQRWLADPLLNAQHVDRGLGISLHARPLRPFHLPADRPVLDGAHRTGAIGLAPQRDREPARLRIAGRRCELRADESWARRTRPVAGRLSQRRWPDVVAGGDRHRRPRRRQQERQLPRVLLRVHRLPACVRGRRLRRCGQPRPAQRRLRREGVPRASSPALRDLFYPEPPNGAATGQFPAFAPGATQSDTFRFAISPPLIKPVMRRSSPT